MSETDPIRRPGNDSDITSIAASQLEPLNAVVEATFSEMTRSVEEQLLRLSTDSRVVMRDMVDSILDDLTRLAAEELIKNPLERALGIGGTPLDGQGNDPVGSIIRRSFRNG